MQMVEIAKALSLDARIIIMDEPTSSLTAGESRAAVRDHRASCRRDGIGIIYISHRMEEVLTLADRITVLRDGRYVGDLAARRGDARQDRRDDGRPRAVSAPIPRATTAIAGSGEASVLEGRRTCCVPGAPRGVSFIARRGEILGFAGLVGVGPHRTDARPSSASRPALGGTMTLDGEPYAPRTPRDAIERGVYLVPEDRKRHGLVLPMTHRREHLAARTSAATTAGAGSIARTEQRVAEAEVDAPARSRRPASAQKVVNLSRRQPAEGRARQMAGDEPEGADPRRADARHRRRRQGRDLPAHRGRWPTRGSPIIMVSSDMEEVIGMSDRVVVMHERRIRGVLARGELTQERIGALMTGHDRANEEKGTPPHETRARYVRSAGADVHRR